MFPRESKAAEATGARGRLVGLQHNIGAVSAPESVVTELGGVD